MEAGTGKCWKNNYCCWLLAAAINNAGRSEAVKRPKMNGGGK